MPVLNEKQWNNLMTVFAETKAEYDIIDESTFVQTEQFVQAQKPGVSVIIGRKGAGKTALLKGYRTLRAEDYKGIVYVNVNALEFDMIYAHFYSDALQHAQGVQAKLFPRIPLTNFVSAERIFEYAWKNSFISLAVLELDRSIAGGQLESGGDLGSLSQAAAALRKNLGLQPVQQVAPQTLLNGLFSHFLSLLSSLTPSVEVSNGTRVGVSLAPFVTKIETYLTGRGAPELEATLVSLRSAMAATHALVLIECDQFDDFLSRMATPAYLIHGDAEVQALTRRALLMDMLKGLVDAVHSIKTAEDGIEGMHLLVTVPTDKFLELDLREKDMIRRKHVVELRWDMKELLSFTGRRIAKALDLPFSPDDARKLWGRVFPGVVQNRETDVPEDSFLYMVRHSQWRPRDLQRFLRDILERCSGKRTIDPEDFAASIHTTCSTSIRDEFLQEFQTEYPFIHDVINQLRGTKNLRTQMDYDALYSCLRNQRLSHAISSPRDVIIRLFEMGVVGVRATSPSCAVPEVT